MHTIQWVAGISLWGNFALFTNKGFPCTVRQNGQKFSIFYNLRFDFSRLVTIGCWACGNAQIDMNHGAMCHWTEFEKSSPSEKDTNTVTCPVITTSLLSVTSSIHPRRIIFNQILRYQAFLNSTPLQQRNVILAAPASPPHHEITIIAP